VRWRPGRTLCAAPLCTLPAHSSGWCENHARLYEWTPAENYGKRMRRRNSGFLSVVR
jgi:hypothetical protein